MEFLNVIFETVSVLKAVEAVLNLNLNDMQLFDFVQFMAFDGFSAKAVHK